MKNSAVLSQEPKLADAALERRARRFWVGMIVGLLGLQIAIGVVSIMIATGDGSAAVLPNYYESAVNWDVTRRARLKTAQLGWAIEYAVLPPEQGTPRREMRVMIADPQRAPISGLNLAARVYHHAHGQEIFTVQFEEVGAGQYVGQVPLVQRGLWQVDLRMEGPMGIAADNRQITVQ
ncbi:MAG: hypothetical protein D6753_05595 [Planctomycetota bacterium]|nr:MAG: hypothetical protein D6753_05595 [Planctomycetota bacterium]